VLDGRLGFARRRARPGRQHLDCSKLIGSFVINHQIRIQRQQFVLNDGCDVLRSETFAAGVDRFEMNIEIVRLSIAI
jgi:hypothetical protein